MPLLGTKGSSDVLIVGCGGMALELYDYLCDDDAINFRGFLDDDPQAQAPGHLNLPLLGTTANYCPSSSHEAVLVGIGNAYSRSAVLKRLWARGISTPAYIARNAHVSPHASIAAGCVVAPFTVINHGSCLAPGVLVNIHCGVGHGAKVGSFSVLSPHCIINGDASIGDRCFLGTRSTIFPRTHIGSDCVVDSHTGVRRGASDKTFISDRGKYRQLRLPPSK